MAEPVGDLFLFAQLARALIADTARCLAENDRPVPERQFISHCKVPADCCEYLTVGLPKSFPVEPGTMRPLTSPDRCASWEWALEWVLILGRDCRPVTSGNRFAPAPAPSALTDHADGLLLDLRVLQCCIAPAVLDVFARANAACSDLMPGTIQCWSDADCSGWQYTFRTTVPTRVA